MAETRELTLRDHMTPPTGPAKRLPDCPGFWIRREEGMCDEVLPVDRGTDGLLCWFWLPGRPLGECDRGEYYGPFRLVPASPLSTETN